MSASAVQPLWVAATRPFDAIGRLLFSSTAYEARQHLSSSM